MPKGMPLAGHTLMMCSRHQHVAAVSISALVAVTVKTPCILAQQLCPGLASMQHMAPALTPAAMAITPAAQELGRALHMALYVWEPDGILTNACDNDIQSLCLKDRPNMARTPGAVNTCLKEIVGDCFMVLVPCMSQDERVNPASSACLSQDDRHMSIHIACSTFMS